MWYDNETKQIVVDDDTRINVSALIPEDAILERVVYNEEEENLKLYVRLMSSIRSINVNYVITRDGNTGSVEDGTA